MSIADNVARIRDAVSEAAIRSGRAPGDITLVAATKTVPAERVREAVAAGIKVCGENRVQEFIDKQAAGAFDGCVAHFIGTLQRNKVKSIVGRAALIQSVDSVRLAEDIGRKSEELGIISDILLEVNIGREESKSGFLPGELEENVAGISQIKGLKVCGLMSIPPFSGDSKERQRFFSNLNTLFVDIRANKYDNVFMDILSMGMSGDFEEAISRGATMVRVGSAIFGDRL